MKDLKTVWQEAYEKALKSNSSINRAKIVANNLIQKQIEQQVARLRNRMDWN